MTINNSAAVFENQFPKIRKAHVIIEYGKPIYIKELPKEQQKSWLLMCRILLWKRITKTRKKYEKKPETIHSRRFPVSSFT